MTSSAVVQRYAQALYQEAADSQQVQEDVALMIGALEDSRELRLCMASPVVPRTRKSSVIAQLFGTRVQPLTHKFLQLLVSRQREDLLPLILKQVQVLSDQRKGIIHVKAHVAEPLDASARTQLTEALEDRLGQSVRLSVTEDESLIGGLVLRIGDTVYDGSVRYQLSALRKRMHL